MSAQSTEMQHNVRIVFGDLLDQQVEAIVNAWNRNILPWWLLLPRGVSGAIKRRAGLQPFHELRRHGPIPLGGAVITSTGRLPHKAIIHVAGINLLWRASETSIRKSVTSALDVAQREAIRSLAIPAIGAGSGGFDEGESVRLIVDELSNLQTSVDVTIVRYQGRIP